MDRAFWVLAPGRGAVRPVTVPRPGAGEVLVRTRCSAISRGTESLVFSGGVPAALADRMRAPFQEGDFPGPVKYGYLAVGDVESAGEGEWVGEGESVGEGEPAGSGDAGSLVGRTVFCLHPHQTRFVVPADAVVPVPDGVPPERAVLAGIVETAVNALWDAAPRVGDRVAVIGAGLVGASVAALLARFPGVRLQLVDVDPGRAALARALGVPFTTPEAATGGCDLVVHASASPAGLARALELLGDEGEVIELSWYGDRPVPVPLGGPFHPGRLAIRSSQVGRVSPSRAPRRSPADRLALALELLADDRFDALIGATCAFDDLPAVLADLDAVGGPGIRVTYP